MCLPWPLPGTKHPRDGAAPCPSLSHSICSLLPKNSQYLRVLVDMKQIFVFGSQVTAQSNLHTINLQHLLGSQKFLSHFCQENLKKVIIIS